MGHLLDDDILNLSMDGQLKNAYIPLLEKYVREEIRLPAFSNGFYKTYKGDPYLYWDFCVEYPDEIERALTNIFLDLECMDFEPGESLYISEMDFKALCKINLDKLRAIAENDGYFLIEAVIPGGENIRLYPPVKQPEPQTSKIPTRSKIFFERSKKVLFNALTLLIRALIAYYLFLFFTHC